MNKKAIRHTSARNMVTTYYLVKNVSFDTIITWFAHWKKQTFTFCTLMKPKSMRAKLDCDTSWLMQSVSYPGAGGTQEASADSTASPGDPRWPGPVVAPLHHQHGTPVAPDLTSDSQQPTVHVVMRGVKTKQMGRWSLWPGDPDSTAAGLSPTFWQPVKWVFHTVPISGGWYQGSWDA